MNWAKSHAVFRAMVMMNGFCAFGSMWGRDSGDPSLTTKSRLPLCRVLAFSALLCIGCGVQRDAKTAPPSEQPSADVLHVFASIAPIADVVERIGGSHVGVNVLLKAGQEPHTFEPTPKQMAELAQSNVYFQVGTLPFERTLVPRLQQSAPKTTVVDVSKGVKLRAIEEAEHEHGHAEETTGHGMGADPHIWLGPREVRVIAQNVTNALNAALPGFAADFAGNLAAFDAELTSVQAAIQTKLEPFRGEAVFVFHPAFGYFTDTYGLKQTAVEIQGKSPTPKQIQEVIEKARQQNAHILFVQPQFDKKSAEAIAQAINGVVVPVDPLARDILSNFTDIAGKMGEALAGGASKTAATPGLAEAKEHRHGA